MTFPPRTLRLLALPWGICLAFVGVRTAQAQALPATPPPAIASDGLPVLPVAAEATAAKASQPGPTVTPSSTPAYGGGRSSLRLASVPHMYGDFGGSSGQLFVSTSSFSSGFSAGSLAEINSVDLPSAGGSRRVKICENNAALPIDRVFFFYNHFHNALDAPDPLDPAADISSPIDRYTVGFEKTFQDGWASVELRLPFAGTYDYDNTQVAVESGNFGNLAVTLKQLLSQGDSHAFAVGLGIDIPTGSDVTGSLSGTPWRIENESLHFLPFIGGLWTPTDLVYVHAFVQLDIAAGGNGVEGGSPATSQTLGVLTEQNLMYVDVATGYWLFRNAGAAFLTGLAASLELHYNTTLQDVDFVTGLADNTQLTFGSTDNRFDVLNLTAGLNAELWNTAALRIAAVTPISAEPDRFFDAEVQVSFIWRL